MRSISCRGITAPWIRLSPADTPVPGRTRRSGAHQRPEQPQKLPARWHGLLPPVQPTGELLLQTAASLHSQAENGRAQQGPAVSQQHCAFHQVLQFAHIAGKVILLQPCNGAFRKGSGRQLIFTRIHAYKKSGQFQHVIPAFAQRRQTQGNNVQPKIQVLTELALFTQPSRSRLVVASTRTSTLMVSVPPTRSISPS